jgi:hypothetical protein
LAGALASLPLAALASAPSSAAAVLPYLRATQAIEEMVAIFTRETLTYQQFGELPEELANSLTIAAHGAANAVLDLPPTAGHPDYLPALALIQRRWLVMDGRYTDSDGRGECLLVDAALSNHRFDAVPLLWHIHGTEWPTRPSNVELQASWKEA